MRFLKSHAAAVVSAGAILGGFTAANTGDLTVYSGTLPTGNCGLSDGSAKAKTHFAAIGAPRWDGAMNCGRCATARCTSEGCPGTPVTVMITDQCPECAADDLDFSAAAYNEITGNMSPSRLTIEWDFVTCPEEYVSGNGKVFVKTGSNEWWFALQPQNFLEKVVEIKVNDIVLNSPKVDPITSYFFVGQVASGISGPLSITVKSESGEVLTQRTNGIPAAGTFLDMQGQFGFGSATAASVAAKTNNEDTPVVLPVALPPTSTPPEKSNTPVTAVSQKRPVNSTADVVSEATQPPPGATEANASAESFDTFKESAISPPINHPSDKQQPESVANKCKQRSH